MLINSILKNMSLSMLETKIDKLYDEKETLEIDWRMFYLSKSTLQYEVLKDIRTIENLLAKYQEEYSDRQKEEYNRQMKRSA